MGLQFTASRAAARKALSPTQRARIRRVTARMLRAVALSEKRSDLEAGLILTDDAEIQGLNRDFRDKDNATDVLAFAMREAPGGHLSSEMLGDVVISVETARRQAKRGLEREILFLFSHGLCHLIGYDHQTDAQEAKMPARMRALLAEGNRDGRVRAA